jgi:hypothetical protein
MTFLVGTQPATMIAARQDVIILVGIIFLDRRKTSGVP